MLSVNEEIPSSEKLQTIFVAKKSTRKEYGTSFYLPNQKTSLNNTNQEVP